MAKSESKKDSKKHDIALIAAEADEAEAPEIAKPRVKTAKDETPKVRGREGLVSCVLCLVSSV